MTTEPRSPKPQPWLRATALELRLYVAAVLAIAYVVSWRVIGGVGAPNEAPIPAPPVAGPPRYVWLEHLPVAARPVIQIPTGWRLASDAPAAETAAPAKILRTPARPRVRVRTRSS